MVTIETNGKIDHACDDWKVVSLGGVPFVELIYNSGNRMYYPIQNVKSIFVHKEVK